MEQQQPSQPQMQPQPERNQFSDEFADLFSFTGVDGDEDVSHLEDIMNGTYTKEEDSESADRQQRDHKLGVSNAVRKANREKARRNRLNDQFLELAEYCRQEGKPAEQEKSSILVRAADKIHELLEENKALRQENAAQCQHTRCAQLPMPHPTFASGNGMPFVPPPQGLPPMPMYGMMNPYQFLMQNGLQTGMQGGNGMHNGMQKGNGLQNGPKQHPVFPGPPPPFNVGPVAGVAMGVPVGVPAPQGQGAQGAKGASSGPPRAKQPTSNAPPPPMPPMAC